MAEIPPHLRHLTRESARASHLRVIDGGKKEKNPFRMRLFTGATLVSLAIAGGSAAISIHGRLNSQAMGASSQRIPYYSPVSISPPVSVKVPEYVGLSPGTAPKEKMENLSTMELIGKLFPAKPHGMAGPEMSGKIIEHNYASLLLEMRGGAAVPELVRALESEQGEFRRESIAFILGRIGDPSALGALSQSAEKDGSPSVRAAAREAIGEIEKR